MILSRKYLTSSAFTAAILSIVLCVSLSVGVRAATYTLSAYDSQLSKIQADLASASAGNAGAAKKAIDDTQAIQFCQVIMPDLNGAPSLIYPENRPLLTRIHDAQESGSSSDFQIIEATVADTRAALPLGQAVKGAVDPQQSIRAVMSRPAFASAPVPPESAWDKFWDWVADQIKKIHWPHSSTPIMPTISPVVPEAILIVLAVAAVAAICYFIIKIYLNYEANTAAKISTESMLAINAEERELVATHNYARLRQLGSEAASAGNYRSAFRLTFLAILVFLDAEGTIKLNRSRTNWEYLRGLGSRQDVASSLRPLVRDFDRIWYGEEEATAADYDQASVIYDHLSSTVMPASTVSSGASANLSKAKTEVH